MRTLDELDDSNRKQEFVRDASPASWLEYGEELRDSAEIIWERSQRGLRLGLVLDAAMTPAQDLREISSVSRTYILLAGFSLENVIKGILVNQDPTHINGGVLSRDLKSHDLVALASKLEGFALSAEEQQLCKMVSEAIPYWGRYPIPLKSSQVTPEIGVNGERRDIFLALFDRLAYSLYWAIRDGWDSGVGPKTLKIRSERYGDRIDPGESLF